MPLLPYLSADAELDRDVVLRGEKFQPVSGPESRRFPLRNLFIAERDVMIGRIIEQYFLAVQKRWPEAWNYRGTGIMLNRTNGFRALMRLFGRIYNHLAGPGDYVEMRKFLELFKRVDVSWRHFSVEKYRPGTSGEVELKKFLEHSIFED